MKEQLKRQINKTYLILSSENEQYEESYEIEMIIKNVPQTILPLHVLRVDGTIQLFYDVSSKQTLKDCADRAKLSAETIRILFQTVDTLIKEMKDYLLNMESVLLDLEHIYTKGGNFYFCYCPWEKRDVLISFRMMLEEILGNLDYHDTEGVELTYHLYQSACQGNFHIAEILKEHGAKEKQFSEDVKEQEVDILAFPEKPPKELLRDVETKEKEPQNTKKPGILRRILQFFMKKQSDPAPEKNDFPHQEMYQTFFDPENQKEDCTQLLVPADESTVLLQNMPMGNWRLRPLLPGYEEFCIMGESFLVGKKRDCVDGYIDRNTISRIHSRLFVKQERLFIADANSRNGTFVNGSAIEPGKDVEIFAGDRILFADVGYECYNSL